MKLIVHGILFTLIILSYPGYSSGTDTSSTSWWKTLDIDSVSVSRRPDYIQLPVRGLPRHLRKYEESSRHLHPDIVYDSSGWPDNDQRVKSWPYWLAITPMVSSQKEENPHLLASRNGRDWTYIIGRDSADSVINPLFIPRQFSLDSVFWYGNNLDTSFYDTTDGHHDSITYRIACNHLSDVDLLIDHNRIMHLFFRVSYTASGIDMSAVYTSRSHNGLDWSSPSRITHLGRFLCPAVIQNHDGRFDMYVPIKADHVSGISDRNDIYRFHSFRSDKIWQYCGPVGLPEFSGYPWHIDVLCMGPEELLMIINSRAPVALWLARTNNRRKEWDMASQPFMTCSGDNTEWDAFLYRASGCWKATPASMSADRHNSKAIIDLYYSAYCLRGPSQSFIWHTGRAELVFNRVVDTSGH